MSPRDETGGTAAEVAQRFLALLDARHWRQAAELVHTESADRFRAQQLELLRLQSTALPSKPGVGETRFESPGSLFGSMATAGAQPATVLLARFAEVMDPVSVLAAAAPGYAGQAPRVTRTLVSCTERDDGTARAEFRLAWEHARPGSLHGLALERAPGGWRIREADLAPLGGGRLLLPHAEFAALCDVFAEDAAS
jgi:hypothetical protein